MLATTRRILLESNPRWAFLASLRAILGDQREVWTPRLSDGLITVDDSGFGHKITHSATPQGRLSARGNGAALTFNGTDQGVTTPDSSSLTFGTGTADLPFSIVALVNVTNTAADRSIIGRGAAGGNEWWFYVTGLDSLALRVSDQSVPAHPTRTSDSAITMGAWQLFGSTYSGVGGGGAADGMALYANGAVIASSAANNLGYVAMEDRAIPTDLGFLGTGNWFSGSIALVAVCQKALSAGDHAAIASLCRAYFGLAL